jgi:hypothetical protein
MMSKESLPPAELIASIKPGQRVLADKTEIGEVVDVEYRDQAPFIHIRRYGPGDDDLFVPAIAVDRVVGNELLISVHAADLLGEAWHESPKGGV